MEGVAKLGYVEGHGLTLAASAKLVWSVRGKLAVVRAAAPSHGVRVFASWFRPIVLVAVAACATASAPQKVVAVEQAPRGGQHDFDFHLGSWKTHVTRRLRPLTGSTTWVEYEGTTVVRPIWNGRANLVELVIDGPAGHLELLSLRLYDPDAATWALHVASAHDGAMSPPTVGRFADGRGVFTSRETIGGRSVLVRFTISAITTTSCRFEQAFSADDGATWEVNWIATDTRTAAGSG